MATTKQDMPEQMGKPPRENRIIKPDPRDELNSGSMWACGTYDPPRIVNVTAAVWLSDWSATVPSSSVDPGGLEKGATLLPGNMWQVQFTDLVDTPDPAQPYHLEVHFWKAGGGLPDREVVDIILSTRYAVVVPDCVSPPPPPPPPPGEGTEPPEGA
jgi:hypothetical protein